MSQRTSRSTFYMNGSAATRVEVEPYPYEQTEPVRRPQKKQVPAKKAARKAAHEEKVNKRHYEADNKALAFDVRYTFFVVTAVFAMVCACAWMLFWMSKIDSQQNHISNLEAQLESIEADNAAYKMSIENMYTLDQIYDVAVNELGMVYARKGQIVYYERADEDYVKQYQDVPASN